MDYLEELEGFLRKEQIYFKNLEVILFVLRDLQFIDDVALSVLLKASKLKKIWISQAKQESYDIFKTKWVQKVRKNSSELTTVFSNFKKNLKNEQACNIDTYQRLVSHKIVSEFLTGGRKKREFLLKILLDDKVLNLDQVRFIKKHVNGKVNNWSLTLKNYSKKLKHLKVGRKNNYYNLFSGMKTKEKRVFRSQRIKLFESFTALQIRRMAKLMKESFIDNIVASTVLVSFLNKESEIIKERIVSSPSHIFRCQLKLLEKDRDQLKKGFLFKRSGEITYNSLLMALFEFGLVDPEKYEKRKIGNVSDKLYGIKSRYDYGGGLDFSQKVFSPLVTVSLGSLGFIVYNTIFAFLKADKQLKRQNENLEWGCFKNNL